MQRDWLEEVFAPPAQGRRRLWWALTALLLAAVLLAWLERGAASVGHTSRPAQPVKPAQPDDLEPLPVFKASKPDVVRTPRTRVPPADPLEERQ